MVAGDLDNDGDMDLVVDDKTYGSPAIGRVYIFYQDGSWPTSSVDADMTLIGGGSQSAQFGQSIVTGDLDGDLDTDLVVGAFLHDVGTDTNEGRIYLYHQVPFSEPETTATIGNESPVIMETVSDGGSSLASPTVTDVNFSAKAKDINGNQYYLAVCKTDVITAGDDDVPTCDTDQTWDVSDATNSTVQATATYTSSQSDAGNNDWYAFVCDKVAGGGICFPETGSGDQGLALGTVTFSGVPVDGATVTIDSITYEFDTADDGITSGTEVDTSASQVEADVAAELTAVEAGTGSHMVARSDVVYVYADAKGVGGNSLGLAEAGDTGDKITLSGANLAGGSDDLGVNLAGPADATQ